MHSILIVLWCIRTYVANEKWNLLTITDSRSAICMLLSSGVFFRPPGWNMDQAGIESDSLVWTPWLNLVSSAGILLLLLLQFMLLHFRSKNIHRWPREMTSRWIKPICSKRPNCPQSHAPLICRLIKEIAAAAVPLKFRSVLLLFLSFLLPSLRREIKEPPELLLSLLLWDFPKHSQFKSGFAVICSRLPRYV